jgi:hypothetical protein
MVENLADGRGWRGYGRVVCIPGNPSGPWRSFFLRVLTVELVGMEALEGA